jgi:hypothetical protein
MVQGDSGQRVEMSTSTNKIGLLRRKLNVRVEGVNMSTS